MRKVIIGALMSLACLVGEKVSAQFSRQINIGIGAGITHGKTDLANNGNKAGFYGELDYIFTPFISIGVHGETGNLRGVGHNSKFENNYFVGNINGKVHLGRFVLDANRYRYFDVKMSPLSRILSNIYIGAGVGLMKNKIDKSLNPDFVKYVENDGGAIYRNASITNIILPVNVGIDVPIGSSSLYSLWTININYQHTYTLDDNIDGISFGSNDQYGFVSLGVKYALTKVSKRGVNNF